MAWTAPQTFVANSILTAGQMNQQVRDNLAEMLPHKAKTEGGFFVTTQSSTIEERNRASQTLVTGCTTSSTTYADPTTGTAGPTVTLKTGSFVICFIRAELYNTMALRSGIGVEVTGATPKILATDTAALTLDGSAGNRIQATHMIYFDTLTPGVNTFTCKYRVNSGAGTLGNFPFRQLSVFPY